MLRMMVILKVSVIICMYKLFTCRSKPHWITECIWMWRSVCWYWSSSGAQYVYERTTCAGTTATHSNVILLVDYTDVMLVPEPINVCRRPVPTSLHMQRLEQTSMRMWRQEWVLQTIHMKWQVCTSSLLHCMPCD